MRPPQVKLTARELAQLRAAAKASGLGHVAGWESAAEPALALDLGKPLARQPALGKSHIGGLPDLPASEPWPQHQGEALTFVAQIDLSKST